jgi:hypothetical protein
MEATMTRFEVTRHVAADPAGVALLLAEPASWSDLDHHWVIAPPHRVGDGFAAALQVTAHSDRLARGVICVAVSAEAGSEMRLVINARDRAVARDVEQSAATFLAELSERARARSFAA